MGALLRLNQKIIPTIIVTGPKYNHFRAPARTYRKEAAKTAATSTEALMRNRLPYNALPCRVRESLESGMKDDTI